MWNRLFRVAVVLICATAVLAFAWARLTRPRRDFDRLLAGDTDVAVASVFISGQGKVMQLNDPASMTYLTNALRSVQRAPNGLGVVYSVEVCLVGGGSVRIRMFLPGRDAFVAISVKRDLLGIDDPDYYSLRLPEPAPTALAETLRRLE